MTYTPYTPIVVGSLNWGVPLNTAIQNLDAANNGARAQDQGMIAWQFDHATNMVATAVTSGTIQWSKLYLRQPATITSVSVHIGTVGAALVAGQNFGALYDSAGIRLGVTADQTANWGTVGYKEMALTAPVPVTAGYYYVAILSNAGTTPAFARGSALTSSIVNANLTATTARFATGPAAQTSMPPAVALGSRTLTGNALWTAVS
jgi:hypothetical protein